MLHHVLVYISTQNLWGMKGFYGDIIC